MEDKEIKDIDNQIKILQEKKKEIQSDCVHKTTFLKFIDGSNVIKEFCKKCGKDIGYPQKDDLDIFLNGKNKTI